VMVQFIGTLGLKDDAMVYRGHIENGVVLVDDAASLPDGARVEIRVLAEPDGTSAPPERPWMRFSGMIKDLPADASETIDQVLYGRGDR
jgi:hypothetical protein